MDKSARIFVAGHRGLAGSAIVRELAAQGYRDVITRTHAELDLEDAAATQRFFQEVRPQLVFLAAAKVGGILANNSYPADFVLRNLKIEVNVIDSARLAGTERLVFLGSSCIYPREAPQPIKEEYLLTGPLEATNRPYAIAKIAGIELCWSFNRQYGTRFLSAMPTNLYGPGDNYDLNNSHVLPALIRKMHEARTTGRDSVVIWGSGKPLREIMHADDLARALVFLASLDEARFAALTDPGVCPLINIGTAEEYSIRELAEAVARAVGYRGSFVYDTSKPDGTPRKVMEVSRIKALGWRPTVELHAGLVGAYRDFLENWASR
ncbi:MAG TPA: GDP-L-fucose synthase [Burkholderiaceae bacterium]|nr:GDP-L-fucose synthase [Burkholderiaceae bacterium]